MGGGRPPRPLGSKSPARWTRASQPCRPGTSPPQHALTATAPKRAGGQSNALAYPPPPWVLPTAENGAGARPPDFECFFVFDFSGLVGGETMHRQSRTVAPARASPPLHGLRY